MASVDKSDGWTVAATGDGAIAALETADGIVALTSCDTSSADAKLPVLSDSTVEQLALLGPEPDEPAVARGGGVRLKDVATDVGLGERVDTYGGLVADLDGDGWQDIFYSRHFDIPAVALGGPDGFRQPEHYPFEAIDRHNCGAADIDADGTVDIFCAVGRAKGRVLLRHDLAVSAAHEDGGVHKDAAGAHDPFGRGRDAIFLRLDDDEYPELFIITAPDRVDGTPGTNRFFRNVGGELVPAPEIGLDRSTGGACAFAADVDGDGDEDLLHCVESPRDGRLEGLRVYRNDEGTLKERSRPLKVKPMKDIAAAVADLDGDRWPDLVQLNSTRLRISLGTRKGFKEAFSAPITKGKAIATGDVDGDGNDDIYVARASASENLEDVVLLSRPGKKTFKTKQLRLPAVEGNAEDVIAIDHDQNGLMDFLVLNGRLGKKGPVQLIASYKLSAGP